MKTGTNKRRIPAFHAIYNHGLSTQIKEGGADQDIIPPGAYLGQQGENKPLSSGASKNP